MKQDIKAGCVYDVEHKTDGKFRMVVDRYELWLATGQKLIKNKRAEKQIEVHHDNATFTLVKGLKVAPPPKDEKDAPGGAKAETPKPKQGTLPGMPKPDHPELYNDCNNFVEAEQVVEDKKHNLALIGKRIFAVMKKLEIKEHTVQCNDNRKHRFRISAGKEKLVCEEITELK